MDKQQISFSTQRLFVESIKYSRLVYDQLCKILTPEVTKYLPESFQGINSVSDAREWLNMMQSNSQVLSITNRQDGKLIGLLIIYVNNNSANIGYLFAETSWRQGFASELLDGFINMVKKETSWKSLIGGVSISNKASSILLEKKGFKKINDIEDLMLNYLLYLK